MRNLFMRLDKSEKGYLGVEELTLLAEWLHDIHFDRTKATEEELEETLDHLFVELDPNQNGQVQFEIFRDWYYRATENTAYSTKLTFVSIHLL